MSLVGTRPPTVDEYEQYELGHRKRLAMKPGLTGISLRLQQMKVIFNSRIHWGRGWMAFCVSLVGKTRRL